VFNKLKISKVPALRLALLSALPFSLYPWIAHDFVLWLSSMNMVCWEVHDWEILYMQIAECRSEDKTTLAYKMIKYSALKTLRFSLDCHYLSNRVHNEALGNVCFTGFSYIVSWMWKLWASWYLCLLHGMHLFIAASLWIQVWGAQFVFIFMPNVYKLISDH
jgi:hypothetical protein